MPELNFQNLCFYQQLLTLLYTLSVTYRCSSSTPEPLVATLKKGTRVIQSQLFLMYFYFPRSTDYQNDQELVTSHPSSPTTQLAGLGCVSASAKVTAILFPVPASPSIGRAGCRSTAQGSWKQSRQHWACLALVKAVGLGLLSHHR